ncbi:MAG TPA: endonuclease MutS2 [Chloroflexia bacterium]|nr:endonuclease MutS2 [Chloroflexia bacterium]
MPITLNDKSLHTLEFPKVRERLASHTSFSASHELAMQLLPSSDIAQAQRNLRITTEAVQLLALRPDITTGGTRDVRDIVGRAALGSLLDPTDILLVKATLAASRNLRNLIAHTAEARSGLDTLRFIASGISTFPRLEAEIERCINDDGQVLDSASDKLSNLRKSIRAAHSRLMAKLQQILQSESYARALQEPIYTLREGRYVVPVKRDFQGALRGVVHDQSNSGSTLFVEPLAIVDLGNEWRQLQLEEYQEIERILRELGALIGKEATAIKTNVDIVADIDLALAKARYSLAIDGVEPQLLESGKQKGPQPLLFKNARHPLLTGKVVPTTIELGGEFRILVITGPNTGGKTVALKTVGLLTLMAQAGLHIPADPGSRAVVFQEVFADIGDEQSIEQSLSTFSSHMSNIVNILRRVAPDSLVLLDELGAGTDPQEGSALARSIITHLLEVGTMAVCTTHYSELKAFAFSTPGVENASVEFDINTLSPTYRLMIGVAGRSNALAIASRLGLNHKVIGLAKTFIDPHEQHVDNILDGIRRERNEARKEHDRAEGIRRDLQRRTEEMERQLAQADEIKARAEEEARQRVEQELETLRTELRQLRGRVEAGLHATSDETLTRQWVTQAQLRAEQMDKELRARSQEQRKERNRTQHVRQTQKAQPDKPHTYGPGDLVFVNSLGAEGDVISAPDQGGQIEVQVGAFKMRVPTEGIVLRKPAVQVARENAAQPSMVRYMPSVPKEAPPLEYDFRGWRAEAVIEELDRRLDEASVAGMPFLRIIHGKGTGALRKAVREYLNNHPVVREVETAPLEQGGEGVTIVRL